MVRVMCAGVVADIAQQIVHVVVTAGHGPVCRVLIRRGYGIARHDRAGGGARKRELVGAFLGNGCWGQGTQIVGWGGRDVGGGLLFIHHEPLVPVVVHHRGCAQARTHEGWRGGLGASRRRGVGYRG